MSLNNSKNSYFNFSENQEINFKIMSYSFTSLCENSNPIDIYSGNESIPFEKRDALYKNILRKEFSNAIKEFKNIVDEYKKVI